MPPEPMIYAFCGLIAGGKSYLAAAWAECHGLAHHNSDALRKELAGVAVSSHDNGGLDAGIYTPEFTRRTYAALLDCAAADLDRGRPTVLDASYLSGAERQRLLQLAERYDAGVYFIFCSCDDREVKRRLAERALDVDAVSDGTWEIYQSQKKRFVKPDEPGANGFLYLDTEAKLADLLVELDNKLPIP